jgi:hypothetical protein
MRRVDQEALLEQLERLAGQLGVQIKVGKYEGKSGMAKWKGQWVLLLDKSTSVRDRVRLLAEELAQFDLNRDDLTVPPEVREWIDKHRSSATTRER